MSYWELYRADLDPLAQFYAARHHDAGIHLLLGPAQCRGRGLAADLCAWSPPGNSTRMSGLPG